MATWTISTTADGIPPRRRFKTAARSVAEGRATTMATKTAGTETTEPTLCGCGCGVETAKGRRFRQGHDAKLHLRLAKAARAGDQSVHAELKAHGWSVPAVDSPKASKPKPAARKPRATKAATLSK